MRQPAKHGTLSCYTVRRCRCSACRAANTGYYANARAEKRKIGTCVACSAPAVRARVRCEYHLQKERVRRQLGRVSSRLDKARVKERVAALERAVTGGS